MTDIKPSPTAAAPGKASSPRTGASLRKRVWRAARLGRRHLGRATAPLRPLPEFLIVGAQRAGTTSMHRYLLQHPGVLGAGLTKGVHWFDEAYDQPLSWYRAHFPTTFQRRRTRRSVGYDPVTGEASPYYLFHPHVPARIASSLPDARVIVLLRDPVERAWSHYQHNVARGMEPLTFADALTAEPERLAGAEERLAQPGFVDLAHRRGSYVARGRYLEQLERIWAGLPAEQVLVLFTDELDRQPVATLGRVHDLLGLPSIPPTVARRWNQQPPADLPGGTRQRLEAAFAEPDRLLAERLGMNLPWARR